MFSPDGKTLAFASNRARRAANTTPTCSSRSWVEDVPREYQREQRRSRHDRHCLARRSRTGGARRRHEGPDRGRATYIEERMKTLGLQPGGRCAELPTGVPGRHRSQERRQRRGVDRRQGARERRLRRDGLFARQGEHHGRRRLRRLRHRGQRSSTSTITPAST